MAKILLVDDEEELRTMLKIVLESAGHEVEVAGNGQEAVENYSRHPADLVVTDIVMPEKEGIETIVQLRKRYPNVKIIAMSGGGGRPGAQNYLEMAKKLGANHALPKPFSKSVFLDAVKLVLDL